MKKSKNNNINSLSDSNLLKSNNSLLITNTLIPSDYYKFIKIDNEISIVSTSLIDFNDEIYRRFDNIWKADYSAVTVGVNKENAKFEPKKISEENKLNQERLKEYKDKYTSRFLSIIWDEDLDYGDESVADSFIGELMYNNIEDLMQTNRLVTLQWLNWIFINNFDDPIVLTGILRVISRINFDKISPNGPTMALAALNHKSIEVREWAVRAFEKWRTRECLKALENTIVEEKWLQKYINKVITELREELNVPIIKSN